MSKRPKPRPRRAPEGGHHYVDIGDEIDKMVETVIRGMQAALEDAIREVEETLREEGMSGKDLKAAVAAYERLFLMLTASNVCHGIMAAVLEAVNPDMERLFPSCVRLAVESLSCAAGLLLASLAPVVKHEKMSPVLQRLLLAWSVAKATNEILRTSLTSDYAFALMASPSGRGRGKGDEQDYLA